MFELGAVLRSCTVYAAATLLLIGVSLAQSARDVTEVSTQSDVFASIRRGLNDAADRTLVGTLTQRSWMQQPSGAEGGVSQSAGTTIDSVVRVRAAVHRVDQLRPTIEPILREEGIPPELSALVLVESGGLTTALSPKGARGVWQFMPDTARRYGLMVSAATDERLDVAKSTRAAARYLRDLYQQFGDWQLALAAYNAGEQAVNRALLRSPQRSFSTVANVLPQETRNYVPAVLQAISVLGGKLDRPQVSLHVKSAGRVLYASTADSD